MDSKQERAKTTVHLICNAHIDLAWMWDWDEGVAAALATFYSAAELAEEFDYVFCHNEAILYAFAKTYDPALFAHIQKLVREGKWHIMGGWYLQPDCNVPAGESFLRQILLGREFFAENFPQAPQPRIAVNFDSFGHTRGLVQILKKSGYEGYVFCRPMPEIRKLPQNPFLWEGCDGSRIKALRVEDSSLYSSGLGTAREDILRKLHAFDGQPQAAVFWGVGNHGGGPSRKDLAAVRALMEEQAGKRTFLHSTPEAYFAAADPQSVVSTPLDCLIKTYSSVSAVKQKHMQLENRLYSAEKAMAAAQLCGAADWYDASAVRAAEEALCFMEFHDVCSGTSIKDAVESTLRHADNGIDGLDRAFLRAFYAMANHYPQAQEGENPFVLFHFQPYEREAIVESELLLLNALISETEHYEVTMYQDGNVIPSQVIRERSNIHYDRRKRVAYRCRLGALGTTEVILRVAVVPNGQPALQPEGDIAFADGYKSVRIGRQSGLLESFCFGGRELLAGGVVPVLEEDNADPWGWEMERLGTNARPFTVAAPTESGVFGGCRSVSVTEEGELLTEAECLYRGGDSYVRLVYRIWHDMPYIDVVADVLWNEHGRALKLCIPVAGVQCFFGQVAYGTETYAADGKERPAQRFVAVPLEEGGCFTVCNDSGVYGYSMDGQNLYLTLLNGSAYCAHPIEDRALLPAGRYTEFAEEGRHTFRFRIGVFAREACERAAEEFNQPPYSVNMYPHGDGKVPAPPVTVEDCNVVLSAVRRLHGGGYALRLFNNSPQPRQTRLCVAGQACTATLGAYAFETYLWEKGTLTRSARADVF